MQTVYLGEWNSLSVYQPEYNPDEWEVRGSMPPLVHKCPCCKIRWFRRVTEDLYDGLCYWCYLEQFEGEEDMVL